MSSAGRRGEAERNRRAILEAFTELVATRGACVPMYQVARRAGVGQGTLYRHFPERALLVLAVYEQRLDSLCELAASLPPGEDLFLVLLQAITEEETRCPGLLAGLREGSDGEQHLQRLAERAFRLLAGPLHDAQQAGQIRPDLQLKDDVHILFAMIEGALQDVGAASRGNIAARAIEFLTGGVTGEGDCPRFS
jgi:AcrR family transcriptional regulator